MMQVKDSSIQAGAVGAAAIVVCLIAIFIFINEVRRP